MLRLTAARSWLARFPQVTPRNLAITLAVAATIGAVGGAILRARDMAKIRLEVDGLEQEISALDAALARLNADVAPRLTAIEREVFGASPPKPAPAAVVPDAGPQAWQRTRDRELRRRIVALEEHRMRMDAIIDRLRALGIVIDQADRIHLEPAR